MSVIAAMAPNGRLYVGGQNKAYNGEGVVGFLEYLCRRYRRKSLIVIWQGRLCGWGKHTPLPRSQGLPLTQEGQGSPGRPAGLQPGAQSGRVAVEPVEEGFEKQGVPKLGRADRGAGRKNRRDQKRHGTARLILP